MGVKRRQRAASAAVEQANARTDAAFVDAYLAPGAPGFAPWTPRWTHPRTGAAYRLALVGAERLGAAARRACFDLVEETSRADYSASTMGWRPADKQREMREPELRYIVVRGEGADGDGDGDGHDDDDNDNDNDNDNADADADDSVRGFTSLMPTFEAGQPVIYCYEIHLKPELQGTGLGALLLGYQSVVAHNLPPVTSVMLTCFLSNARALRFYRRQGFETDATAPVARRLRGKTVEPDYTILIRAVQRGGGTTTTTTTASAEEEVLPGQDSALR